MADAQVLRGASTGVTANSTTWVDAATIAAGSFDASTEYLIIAIAIGRNASSANEIRYRLVHGTTPTAFTDATDAEEILANTTRIGVGWMARFSQPGTTEAIKVQISSSSTTVATCEESLILAFRLSDLGTEDTDWRWNEVTADLTLTTGYQDGATETFTPNGTDKYLYIGQAAWVPGSATAQTDIALDVDGTIRGLSSEEGEDTANETRNRLFVWAETPTNASHTVKIKAKGETAAGTVLSSRVFVLNLAKFAQAAIDAAAGPTNLTEGAGWINLATAALTPSTTGDFVIVGAVELNWNGATSGSALARLQHDNSGSFASAPAYGDDALGADTWDGTDHRILTLFEKVSLTSGASRTVNLDGQMGNTGVADPIAQARALAMFSVALAAAGPTLKALDVAMTMTPALARGATYGKTLPVSMTMTPVVSRSLAKVLAVAMTLAPVMAAGRFLTKTLAVGMTMTPAIADQLINGRALAVGMTMTPTLERRATHFVALAVAVTMAVGFVRRVGLTLAVGVTMAVAAQRGFYVDMAVATTLAAGISTSFRTTRTLAATSTLTAALNKLIIPAGGGGGAESDDQTARHLIMRR